MEQNIIDARAKIVELSTDKEKTKELLDDLTTVLEASFENQQIIHVSKDTIVNKRDNEIYMLYDTINNYVVDYKGGFTAIIDKKLASAATTLDMIMYKERYMAEAKEITPEDIDDACDASELVLRLPMFIYSSAESTYAIANIAMRYMLLLQKIGAVPTAGEEDDPEVQKFMKGLMEVVDSISNILEKQGKAYEEKHSQVLAAEASAEIKETKPQKQIADGKAQEEKNDTESQGDSQAEIKFEA